MLMNESVACARPDKKAQAANPLSDIAPKKCKK
jgi:hypothetical protein